MKTLKLLINKYLTKFILTFLILGLSYVALCAVRINKYNVFEDSSFTKLYILLATSLLLVFVLLINKMINKMDNDKLKYLNIAFTIILVVLQILLICSFHTEQITDPFYVNDFATAIANGIDKVVDTNWVSYFMDYKNNNFVLLFTIRLIQLANIFHIHNYSKYLVVVNAIMIDLSILFTYFIAKEEKDSKFASVLLFLSILNPINYMMMFWTYTVTYSLPFTTGLILVWLKLRKAEGKKKTILLVLFGLIASLGYLMRPTLIIPIIAISMIYIFDLINKKCKFNKKSAISFGIIVVSLFSSYLLVNHDINRYVHDQDNAFPMTHWIMIGLSDNGTIQPEHNRYTSSFKTEEEKKKATVDAINKTLKEYGLSGLVKHTLKKLPVTWDDGTANYMLRAREDRNPSSLYKWLVGDKNDIAVLYAQAYRIVTLVAIIYFIAKVYDDKKYKTIDLYSLTLFGAILFYLIWEAKYAYSIPFLPIMLILQAKGQNYLIMSESKISNIAKRRIFLLVFAATAALMLADYGTYTGTPYKYNDYKVFISNTAGRRVINDVYKNNKTIRQEFYSDGKYNKICFFVKKLENTNTKYLVSIKDKDTIIYKDTLSINDIEDEFITISIPSDKLKNGKRKYIITIEQDKDSPSNKDSIGWGYMRSKTMDSYDGNLTINGKKHRNDLFIRVYNLVEDEPFISKSAYLFIYAILLGSEIIMYIIDRKSFSNK